jgi:hypothetical protein
MTLSILGQIHARVTDALDQARANGAGLARSAHELVELAHGEATSTAEGTAGRARLIDAESVRVSLVAASIHQQAGRLAAFGEVLAMIDRFRAEEHAAARARVQAEAERDAAAYLRDAEDEPADEYAAGAFDAWYADEDDSVIGPLTVGEARDCYVAAFLRALRDLGGAS